MMPCPTCSNILPDPVPPTCPNCGARLDPAPVPEHGRPGAAEPPPTIEGDHPRRAEGGSEAETGTGEMPAASGGMEAAATARLAPLPASETREPVAGPGKPPGDSDVQQTPTAGMPSLPATDPALRVGGSEGEGAAGPGGGAFASGAGTPPPPGGGVRHPPGGAADASAGGFASGAGTTPLSPSGGFGSASGGGFGNASGGGFGNASGGGFGAGAPPPLPGGGFGGGAGTPPPPPPGGGFGGPRRGPGSSVPWEERERLGAVQAFVETTRLLLASPTAFFRAMPVSGGIGAPLLYGVIVGWIGVAVAAFYQALFRSIIGSNLGALGSRPELEAMVGFMQSWGGFAAQVVFGGVMVAIGIFVWSGILHLLLLLLGGGHRDFEATLRVVAYAQATSLFYLLPFCGSPIAFVWTLVLLVIGLAEAHGIGRGRAAAAVLAPVVLCCCCTIAAFSLLAWAVAGLAG
jgi:hypothetical protein